MGFGHRVYKNYDPRATIIRSQCHKVLESTGNDSNPMFELALELEEIALNDDYFVQRNLYLCRFLFWIDLSGNGHT